MRKLPGQLSITRTMDRRDERPITIRIADTSSGVHVLECRLSLADLALALTGLSNVDCEVEHYDNARFIGARHETKRIQVPGEVSWDATDEALAAILRPYETEGWRGDPSDLKNHHRLSKSGGVAAHEVTFWRFVREDGTPVLREVARAADD